jgi:hypothetical protein
VKAVWSLTRNGIDSSVEPAKEGLGGGENTAEESGKYRQAPYLLDKEWYGKKQQTSVKISAQPQPRPVPHRKISAGTGLTDKHEHPGRQNWDMFWDMHLG